MGSSAAAESIVQSEPGWDQLEVGLRVGPLTYEVTREMVSAFCAAMPFEAGTDVAAFDPEPQAGQDRRHRHGERRHRRQIREERPALLDARIFRFERGGRAVP